MQRSPEGQGQSLCVSIWPPKNQNRLQNCLHNFASMPMDFSKKPFFSFSDVSEMKKKVEKKTISEFLPNEVTTWRLGFGSTLRSRNRCLRLTLDLNNMRTPNPKFTRFDLQTCPSINEGNFLHSINYVFITYSTTSLRKLLEHLLPTPFLQATCITGKRYPMINSKK